MATEEVPEQKNGRKINGKKFYPIHLTNEEIRILITSLLNRSDMPENSHYQVYIRKDKSSKGLDFRLQNSKGMYAKNYLISCSISPLWKLTDVLVHHYLELNYGSNKGVDVFTSEYESEVKDVEVAEIDSIFIARMQNPTGPYRNSLFKRDDWVCVIEKCDVLADTPYK